MTYLRLTPISNLTNSTLRTSIPRLLYPSQPKHLRHRRNLASLLGTNNSRLLQQLTFSTITLAIRRTTRPHRRHNESAPINTSPIRHVTLRKVTVRTPMITRRFTRRVTIINFRKLNGRTTAIRNVFTRRTLTPTISNQCNDLIRPLHNSIRTINATKPLLDTMLITRINGRTIKNQNLITRRPYNFNRTHTSSLTRFLNNHINRNCSRSLQQRRFTTGTTNNVTVTRCRTRMRHKSNRNLTNANTNFSRLTTTRKGYRNRQWELLTR